MRPPICHLGSPFINVSLFVALWLISAGCASSPTIRLYLSYLTPFFSLSLEPYGFDLVILEHVNHKQLV